VPATRLSRYEFAPVHEDEDGRTFFDVPDPLRRIVRKDDARVIVAAGDTVHRIAWRAYRVMIDPEQDIRPTSFFDVVAQMNDVVDVTEPLEPDKIIRVPSIQALVGEIRASPST